MLGRILARVPESVFRALGIVFFLGVIAWRVANLVGHARAHPLEPLDVALWAAETGIFVLIVVGYVRRKVAYERASSAAEILLPLVGGPFPFVLVAQPWAPAVDPRAGLLVVLAGDAISFVSYVFLGGSFSILAEARELRERGPYRFVRHPVYLGQLTATLGVVLVRFSALNAGLWAVFAAIQVTRAWLEERKLARATPGYAEYRERTWMFLPFIV